MATEKQCRWFEFYNCWTRDAAPPCKICIGAINTCGVNAMRERPTIRKLTKEEKYAFIPLPGDQLSDIGL